MLITEYTKETSWRRQPGYQGGFVLDGGVHLVAALRIILGPDDPITTLSAQSQLLQDYLPPVDTVDAILTTQSGAIGVFSTSFGWPFNDFSLEFVCENGGAAKLGFDGITVNGTYEEIPFDGKGVKQEVAAFAQSIAKGGSVDPRQIPEEGLADLEVLEMILKSGEEHGSSKKLSLQK